MKHIELSAMSSANLVERFAEIVVAQDQALLGGEHAKFNRLFRQMMDIANELKAREGDQRRSPCCAKGWPNSGPS
ncbi:MAG TPA: DUF2019 domain-containing protein [Bradyrhizobium sp.]|nr:DUF2019 domain-containing protein [Bradyrhizobium sp.]